MMRLNLFDEGGHDLDVLGGMARLWNMPGSDQGSPPGLGKSSGELIDDHREERLGSLTSPSVRSTGRRK
jgi:hypothetical protein